MKTPFWKTYLALAVLAGLGAYVYFVESKRVVSPEKTKEKVFSLDEDAKTKVQQLSIAVTSGDSLRLVREGASWKLEEPLNVPADTSEVESLITTVKNLDVGDVIVENAADLADYGLLAPHLTVGVLVEGATEPMKLLVGEKVPAEASLYAKRPTSPRIFTIPSWVESSLSKKPFDLRDRDVLHVKRDAIKTIRIEGPEGGYALARNERGEWDFSAPVATPAGRWAVDGLLGTLEGLRMESIASEVAKNLKPFGLVKPVRSVVLGLADGATKRLDIGSSPADKKYHAREASSMLVAVIPSALVDDLAKGMGELRAKRLLDVSAFEVDGFDVEADGGAARVHARSSAKDKDGVETRKWKRTAPETKDIETQKVEDALSKLGGVEVQEFVDTPGDASRYGLDRPRLRLSVRSGAAKPAVSTELGEKEGVIYARRSGDAAVLKLDKAKADELIKAFLEL